MFTEDRFDNSANGGIGILFILLILAFCIWFVSGCEIIPAAATPSCLIGTASWYSYQSCRKEGTNGRITASGKKFDENDYTAAMWDIPFGTKIKVTNRQSGASVVVMVTDRGPAKRLAKKGRIVDLSKTAFAKIADLTQGIIPVRIEYL